MNGIIDNRGPLRQAPNRYSGYYRLTTKCGDGDTIEVPQDAYVAITPGPRHTCGDVWITNKSFQGNNDGVPSPLPPYDLLFREPAILVGPRTHYVGLIEGKTKVLVPPGLTADPTLEGAIVDGEVDLLFWREPPPSFATRADSYQAWRVPLADDIPITFTCATGGRKHVRISVRSLDQTDSDDDVSATVTGGTYDPVTGFQTFNFFPLAPAATVGSGDTQSWVFGLSSRIHDSETAMIPDVVQVEVQIPVFDDGAVVYITVQAFD